jgi:predicted flap endonuclease-1-like 5' DNA nuclease
MQIARYSSSSLWRLAGRHSILRTLATTTSPHQLNINHALKKSQESYSFQELVAQPATTLQGIGPVHHEALKELNLHTVQQLADYKFFHLAKSIQTLAAMEETENRLDTATMNLNKGIDKEMEGFTPQKMLKQPVHILQGISPNKDKTFATLGVKTVSDLANWKYCQWAEAIEVAAKFEE